ncbi:MAG: transcriptional repressor [Candidatus Bipolaricaulota bacterium]
MDDTAGCEADVEERLRALEAACRRVGARVTPQRREILRAVAGSCEHPDAEAVFRSVRRGMPTLSFDTVYRTLAFLEKRGLMRRVHVAGDRTRYDGNPGHHHHFICTKCGRLVDFESETVDRVLPPPEAEALGIAESAQLQVFGLCRSCSTRGKSAKGGER